MFIWTLIIIALVAVFYFNDLPNWLNKAKQEGVKLKDQGLKKVDELKAKNKPEDKKETKTEEAKKDGE